MNWVGGIRNRIRSQNERKQQKEFFERKKFTTTVQRVGHSSPRTSNTHLSMDLLSLRTIHNAHTQRTPERPDAERQSKIRHVDLREHKSHIRMIENMDNHMSPVKHPSKIQIMDTKESMRLEAEDRKMNSSSTKTDESWSKRVTPFTETPANQIFYTHGTRPPTGVKNIPSGLIREIKGRYKKDHQQTDSSEIHTDDKPHYRNHEMKHKITGEDLFPTPILKKEKRVQIAPTATWIPAREETTFEPYSRPAPSSIVTEMQTLEKEENQRKNKEEQKPSLWTKFGDRQTQDRYAPREPQAASTAPDFQHPADIPSTTPQQWGNNRPMDRKVVQQGNPDQTFLGHRWNGPDGFMSRKRPNPFQEDFQMTPLRKYMPKEGKQNKHETKHKRHKRKYDEVEPGKLCAPEKNDGKKKVSPYGGLSIDDILDDAKFNQLQPRSMPENMYQNENPKRTEFTSTVSTEANEKQKFESAGKEKGGRSHTGDIKEQSRHDLLSTVKLPKDFKPLYESTPKTQLEPLAKQNMESNYDEEKFKYREVLASMLFGNEIPRTPYPKKQIEETPKLENDEQSKVIEQVPATPDRGIPLNVKEKRGCMTSPINKANSRKNMLRLEREWSEMMKVAKETKQKLKETNIEIDKKSSKKESNDKVRKNHAIINETKEKQNSEHVIQYKDEQHIKNYSSSVQSSPIDLTVKKNNHAEVIKTEDRNVEDNLNLDANCSGIIIDLTLGKKPRGPNGISTVENTKDAIVAKSSGLDCNTIDETPQQELKHEECVSFTEQLKQVSGRTNTEQFPSEPSSSECTLTVNIPAKSLSPKQPESVLPTICNNTTVKIHALEETKVTSVTAATTTEESATRSVLNVVSFGVQTCEEMRHIETASLGVQIGSRDLKDAGCQCDPMIPEPDVNPVICAPPMANQFCQTEQDVDDKETQSETAVNSASVNTQTEAKTYIDIASSPVRFNSPIKTRGDINSPIESFTLVKRDFQIRTPEVGSVGEPRSESVLLQENVVSTRVWSADTSVANKSKSDVKHSVVKIDSDESCLTGTKEMVSPIQAPCSAANVYQHEEIKQLDYTEAISQKCSINRIPGNNSCGDASVVVEPTKPLESIADSKDHTLSASPKIPRAVDNDKEGEEIVTNEKNPIKEAHSAEPTLATEMRHEGEATPGEESKPFHEGDIDTTVSKPLTSPQSPPLVSSPLVSSDSPLSGDTTIAYSDVSHRSNAESGENIPQEEKKESTSFSALRSELVTSTSHSIDSVTTKTTDGYKEENEGSSKDKVSSNYIDYSVNTTELDFSKIVVPDSTVKRDESLLGTSSLLLGDSGQSNQNDNQKECEDLANNIKDDDHEGKSKTEASDIVVTDQDRKEILLLLEGDSSSQTFPICSKSGIVQPRETISDVFEEADEFMNSEGQNTQIDSSDIQVVPQTDSESEREVDEPEDREVSAAVHAGETKSPSGDVISNEQCSIKHGEYPQKRYDNVETTLSCDVEETDEACVVSTASRKVENIKWSRTPDACSNKERSQSEEGTSQRLHRDIHDETCPVSKDNALHVEKDGESSNGGCSEENKENSGINSRTQTEVKSNQTPHEDISCNVAERPENGVASFSQSHEIPEGDDDKTDKQSPCGDRMLIAAPLGKEVKLNQDVCTKNHGIEQIEELELVEPTQRRQSARRKRTTNPNGTKPKNKFDVPYKTTAYTQPDTSAQNTINTGIELFMSPNVAQTENYQPAIGRNSLRITRSSSSFGKTPQCGKEIIVNNNATNKTGEPSTLDVVPHVSEADSSNRDLDDSKGYLSDWVADSGKRNMRIKFSGKTYERVMKNRKDKLDIAEEDLEYELVKMIAFQEDYEYFTSSEDDFSVSNSPEDEANSDAYSTRGVHNAAKDQEVEESLHDGGQDVCHVEAGNIYGEDEAKINDTSTFKRENSDDKSIEFERELSQLDENKIPNEQLHTGTSQEEKANRKITGENLDDTDPGLGHHECSKDSMKEFEDGEQYDTAEEYG